MYTVGVKRDFVARHFLIGGDWGKENEPHSHHYVLEVRVRGDQLDRHGYVVDIVAIEAALEEQVNRYRDRLLNDLPEFKGLNPSIEHFARILCERLASGLAGSAPSAISVRLWENEIAWTEYQLES